MKIYSAYTSVDKPWGGANSFLRALWQEMREQHNVVMVEDPAQADIAFFNQMSAGPGGASKTYDFSYIDNIKKKNPSLKIVIRVVNLDRLVGNLPWWKYYLGVGFRKDNNITKALRLADGLIYQSNFQKKLFDSCHVKPAKFRVIHNGASRSFGMETTRPTLLQNEDLVLLSVSFSGGKYKRHDYIAQISKVPGVKVHYVGTWPGHVDPANVKMEGVLDHASLLQIMKKAHYLFHPSSYDICPNAVMESLHAGMPIIYNPELETGSEIAGDYGIPYDALNPLQTVQNAKKRYADITQALSADTYRFGIERAARDYYDMFESLRTHSHG